MDSERFLEIIRALADGVDPITGEVYPPDSVYQQPDVIRALHAAEKALDSYTKRMARKRDLPERTGLPWTDEEEKQLESMFQSGSKAIEIAKKLERTKGAIFARLERMGLISAEEAMKHSGPSWLKR